MVLKPLRVPLRKVGRTDQRLVRRSAALPRTEGDHLLRVLSRSANHSGLWFVIAGLLAGRKGATRRGAARGVAAIAGASMSASLVAKRLFPRRRPAAELVPVHRRLAARPTSSSFPSGHAASAAAFVTAVTLESPPAGLGLLPLATAVGYSRIHTGVHWPSDVGAGAAIGVGAALATCHWWPLHPDRPGTTTHRVAAPEMKDGENMIAMVNPSSGDRGVDPTDLVRYAWPKATLLYPDPDTSLIRQLNLAIARSEPRVRALAVAGGDGTVAAVASVAADHGLPLALIPAGTLNHFARDLGVRTMAASDRATEAGAAVGVNLAEVRISPTGDPDAEPTRRWFINTASLGGYPEMVQLRAKLESRMPKWPAAAIAMIRTLRRAQPFHVELDGEPQLVWMVFLGNGIYLPRDNAPARRPALDTGQLDLRYLRADLPYSRARFVLAALTRTLRTSRVYRQRDVRELTVRLLGHGRRIALDGEVAPRGRLFRFCAHPSRLAVYRL